MLRRRDAREAPTAARNAADHGAPLGGVRRILLVQLRFLGDVLLCTPAIRAVRRAYPQARISFLTSAAGAELLGGNPNLDELIVLRPGWRAEWRLGRELRQRGFDLVVDFQSTPRTARLVGATRAPHRVGIRGRGPRNRFYTQLAPRELRLLYAPQVRLDVLARLGIPPETDLSLDLVLGPAQRARAEEVWRSFGFDDGRPVVAISAVSREPWKQWGAQKWAVVADGVAELGAHVLLSSGPGERAQVEAVARLMRHPAVWDYGPTTLRELGAIYERCVLWLGNDGGPKHVAAAVRVPTITVFRWQVWPAWTDTESAVPHLHVEAPPPGRCDMRCTDCHVRGCLAALEPQPVLDSARGQLLGRGGSRPLAQSGAP